MAKQTKRLGLRYGEMLLEAEKCLQDAAWKITAEAAAQRDELREYVAAMDPEDAGKWAKAAEKMNTSVICLDSAAIEIEASVRYLGVAVEEVRKAREA